VAGNVEIEQEEDGVTRPSSLGFPKDDPNARTPDGIPIHREIEVEALDPRPAIGNDGMVDIRMAETIEEFTYGNPHQKYRLEANRRYRLPVDVARYLYKLGYTYQINN
jgi:hypothetical protein